MQARKIKLENLQIGDEVIIVYYERGHIHGLIKKLGEVNNSSDYQSDRDFHIKRDNSALLHNVCNTDDIYLIHRPDKE